MNMNPLRYATSTLVLVSVAALLGASCTATYDPAIDPLPAATEASGERIAESLDPSRPGAGRAPAPPPPGTVTFSCAGFWNGVWCGGNMGFPGSTSALYYCYNGVGQLIVVCPGPCVGGPAGVEDHC